MSGTHVLNERGWLANHWPAGARRPRLGRSREVHLRYRMRAGRWPPRLVPFGVNMLGPVLIKYGNEQQKNYWLPRILSGEDWWCQGYSEPGSGSDLASVKTTAVRDGDHYIVNGQKTWTTLGQHANMIFCLVRTNKEAKAQAGISFLLVDMNTPGVEVRPIHHAGWRVRSQRSVLHRREGAGRETWWAKKTRAGRTPSTC